VLEASLSQARLQFLAPVVYTSIRAKARRFRRAWIEP